MPATDGDATAQQLEEAARASEPFQEAYALEAGVAIKKVIVLPSRNLVNFVLDKAREGKRKGERRSRKSAA